MKKIFLFMMIIGLIFVFSGDRIQSIKFDSAETIEQFKEMYKKHVENYEEMFVINYKGDDKEFNQKYIAYIKETSKESEQISASVIRRTVSKNGDYNYAHYLFQIEYSSNKEKDERIRPYVKEYAKIINENFSTDYYKIKMLNNKIVFNTKYNKEAKNAYTAYGVFVDKEAVCQGYAYATYLILKELGYEAKYVTGVAGEDYTPHAWNMVKIDDQWYHLDTTFNDPTPDKKGRSSYKYLLVSDKVMRKNHKWNKKYYPKAKYTYNERMIANN